MKQVVCLIVVGLVTLLSSYVVAPADAAQMYVPGSWDSDSWNPNSNAMTDNSDGTHSISITGQTPGQRYKFKVVEDTNSDGGDWGPDPAYPNANTWADADGSGTVAFTIDTNVINDGWSTSQYRFSGNADNMDPGAWTFVGDFQSELGGTDWDNTGTVAVMSSIGGGVYEWTGNIAPGSYSGKATNTGSWDAIGPDNRSENTANFDFVVNSLSNVVTIRVDALNGITQLSVVPEPASLALAGLALIGVVFTRNRG